MAAVPVLDEARFGYLKPTDVARLEEAYRFSGAAHAGQTRQSGEPYVSHPLAVAEILAGPMTIATSYWSAWAAQGDPTTRIEVNQ